MQTTSEFIAHGAKSGGSERANYGLLPSNLTDGLGLGPLLPATATGKHGHDLWERPVAFANNGETSKTYIDAYKRGCVILETKSEGSGRNTDPDQAIFRHSTRSNGRAMACPALGPGKR